MLWHRKTVLFIIIILEGYTVGAKYEVSLMCYYVAVELSHLLYTKRC